MGNMSENLFQAIDILTAKKLEGLKYDKTLLCEIIDDSEAKQGQYRVTDGTSTFIAYSDNTSYRNGTSVYITIPEGDYSNRKIITGKYVEEGGEYYTYVAPFESYLDVTNNYIDVKNNQSTLLANGERNETVLWTWKRSENSDKPIPKEYSRMGFKASFQTWLGYLQPVTGSYGIRIDVTSREETKNNSSSTTNKYYSYYLDSSDFYGDIYNFETYYPQEIVFDISMITEIEAIRVVFYQSSDFYTITKEKIATMEDGHLIPDNIYVKDAFLSFGFDASEFIEDTIFLYTLDGETFDPSSQNVKEKLVDGTEIFVNKNKKLLQIRWVHFIDDKETLLVDNQNELDSVGAVVHWYHYKQQEGVCDELAGHFWEEINLDGSGNPLNSIGITVEPDITLQYERYKVIIETPNFEKMMEDIEIKAAAVGDMVYYGGYDRSKDVYIETKNEDDFASGFSKGAIDDEITNYDNIITELEKTDEKNTQALLEFNKNQRDTLVFMQRSYRNKIRQIWADAEAAKKMYISDTFVLTNETLVPDSATIDLVQGLKILVDIAGLKGNYCIYGMTNELLNSREASRARVLEAKYESLVTGEPDLDKASTICWQIPAEGTMIAPPVLGADYVTESYVSGLSEAEKSKYTDLDYIATTMDVNGESIQIVSSENNLIPYEGYYYLIRKGTEDYSKYDADKDGQDAEETSQQISVKQTYKIKKYYQQSATNNTIHCVVRKNNFDHKASSSLNFGHHGSNGSDVTLILQMREYTTDSNGVVTPGNLISALTPGKTAMIEARLFDYNNKEVAIDNIAWSMHSKNTYTNISIGEQAETNAIRYTEKVKINTIDMDGNSIETEEEIVIQGRKVTASVMGSGATYQNYMHNIVKVAVNYGKATFGKQPTTGYDFENVDTNGNPTQLPASNGTERAITLEAYFPIAFTTNADFVWAEIPTQVVYDSGGGNPSYYKDIIKISNSKGVNVAISNCDIVFNDEATNAAYYPATKVKNAGEFYLRPNNMYLSGLSEKVTLVCKSGNDYWVQPLVIIQNRWPSAMLNSWDGSLTIDEKNGTILSTMIGAGRKERDNSFTGVLMGDVETGGGDDNVKYTGVYGYHHGQQSFGLLENGTAFFGKAGKGRIEFNGNNGWIQSMSYSLNGTGMRIDLDDGYLDIRGAKKIKGQDDNNVDPNKAVSYYQTTQSQVLVQVMNPYLLIKDDNAKTLMRVADNNDTEGYYLQSSDYNTDAKTGVKFDLKKGTLTGYNFAFESLGTSDNSRVRLSNISPYFYINNASGKKLIYMAGSSDGTGKYYLQSSDFDNGANTGMKIDLEAGNIVAYDFLLKTKGSSTSSEMILSTDGSSNPFLRIRDTNGKILINVSSGSYYLQSSDEMSKFNISGGELVIKGAGGGQVALKGNGNPFFRINDGSTDIFYAANGSYYMQSSSYSSSVGGIKINFSAGTMEGGVDQTAWSIQKDGSATFKNITAAIGGQIGPFTITSTSIYKGNGAHGSSGTNVYIGDSGISIKDKFKVDSVGDMTIAGTADISGSCYVSGTLANDSTGAYFKLSKTGGTIGGWTIGQNSLSNSKINLSGDGNIYLLQDGGKIQAVASSGRSARAMFNVMLGDGGGGYTVDHYIKFTTSGITIKGTTNITGSTTISGSLKIDSGGSLTIGDATIYDGKIAAVVDIPGFGWFDGKNSMALFFRKGILIDYETSTKGVADFATEINGRGQGWTVI